MKKLDDLIGNSKFLQQSVIRGIRGNNDRHRTPVDVFCCCERRLDYKLCRGFMRYNLCSLTYDVMKALQNISVMFHYCTTNLKNCYFDHLYRPRISQQVQNQ